MYGFHDFTGVRAVVDLAGMCDAITRLGGNPGQSTPLVYSTCSIQQHFNWSQNLGCKLTIMIFYIFCDVHYAYSVGKRGYVIDESDDDNPVTTL